MEMGRGRELEGLGLEMERVFVVERGLVVLRAETTRRREKLHPSTGELQRQVVGFGVVGLRLVSGQVGVEVGGIRVVRIRKWAGRDSLCWS